MLYGMYQGRYVRTVLPLPADPLPVVMGLSKTGGLQQRYPSFLKS